MINTFKNIIILALGIALGMVLFQFADFLMQVFLLMKKLGMQ